MFVSNLADLFLIVRIIGVQTHSNTKDKIFKLLYKSTSNDNSGTDKYIWPATNFKFFFSIPIVCTTYLCTGLLFPVSLFSPLFLLFCHYWIHTDFHKWGPLIQYFMFGYNMLSNNLTVMPSYILYTVIKWFTQYSPNILFQRSCQMDFMYFFLQKMTQ